MGVNRWRKKAEDRSVWAIILKNALIRVDSHYTARHGTTRYDTTKYYFMVFTCSSSHCPSATANDTDIGIERREYFACLLTDGRYECTLVFVVSCRCRVVPYNVNRPLNCRRRYRNRGSPVKSQCYIGVCNVAMKCVIRIKAPLYLQSRWLYLQTTLNAVRFLFSQLCLEFHFQHNRLDLILVYCFRTLDLILATINNSEQIRL
jgi:hypothetical protein